MGFEAVQNYVHLVSGLTRATRAKAVAAARSLLTQARLDSVAADAGDRASRLADEIVTASKANRELLKNLIATEVEQAVVRLGFARVEEVQRLREEVRDLREAVRHRAEEPTPPPAGQEGSAADVAARNAAAKKAAVKKTAAKKAAGKTASTAPKKTANKAAGTATDLPSLGAPGE